MHKAVFLDRDGLINVKAAEHDYIKKPSEFVFLPKAAEGIRILNENGYLVIVVTNQRGIARGIMSEGDVLAVHRHMCNGLSKIGAHIDKIYVCPHNNGECSCRKPDIGLFLKAEQDFPIDRSRSWMIGDSKSDILAGERFGVKTIQTENLFDAVQKIIREN